MQLTASILSVLALSASTLAISTPPIITQRDADPNCFPISKLTSQLQDFQRFSAAILEDAPRHLNAAQRDATNGVNSIVSPIDLLNPQVQDQQNVILADLATVGDKFKQAQGANKRSDIITIASEIQEILFQRLWPNTVTLTAHVTEINDCSSGAKQPQKA
jgi:hypothetical protein